jgi:hypothetical protein
MNLNTNNILALVGKANKEAYGMGGLNNKDPITPNMTKPRVPLLFVILCVNAVFLGSF